MEAPMMRTWPITYDRSGRSPGGGGIQEASVIPAQPSSPSASDLARIVAPSLIDHCLTSYEHVASCYPD